jgi:hypothetical protein
MRRAGRLTYQALFLPIAPTICNAAREAGRVARFVSQQNHSKCGTCRKPIAGGDDFRFIRRMIRVVTADSKLCASRTRHAKRFFGLRRNRVAQLAKGGEAPRLIPHWLPLARQCGTPSRFHASVRESAHDGER